MKRNTEQLLRLSEKFSHKNATLFNRIVLYLYSFEEDEHTTLNKIIHVYHEIEACDELGRNFEDVLDVPYRTYCDTLMKTKKEVGRFTKIVLLFITPIISAFFYGIITTILKDDMFTDKLYRFYDVARIFLAGITFPFVYYMYVRYIQSFLFYHRSLMIRTVCLVCGVLLFGAWTYLFINMHHFVSNMRLFEVNGFIPTLLFVINLIVVTYILHKDIP